MKIRPLAAAFSVLLALAGQAGAQSAPPLTTTYSGSPSLIRDFHVDQPQNYAPGARLFFTAHGEPGSHASVTIGAASGAQSVPLAETSPGTYEGFYTLRPYDNFSSATFSARADQRGRWAIAQASAYVPPAPAPCQNCGSIASVREVAEGDPDANVAGIIAGGIIGGAIGDSLAPRHEHAAGTLLGAIVGGGIGGEVARGEGARRVWIITVALDNGAQQTFKAYAPLSAGAGARVRVVNGQLVLDHP